MMSTTLSVIIPNYNHAHYLRFSLKSLCSQTRLPDEIIVVDDGSTDNSIEIVKEYMKNFRNILLIENKINRGVLFSIERGLKEAKGEYVFLPAADDFVLPDFIEKSMKFLEKYPQSGLCCCDSKTIWEHSGKIIINKRGLCKESCYLSPERLAKIMKRKIVYLSGFATIIRRDALEEVGLIPELKWSHDRIYATIIALRYGVCYIPEILAVQNRRLESYSEKGMRNWNEYRRVIIKILDLLRLPTYKDIFPLVKESSALSSFGIPILKVIFSKKKYWIYFSFNLLRLIIWNEFKIFIVWRVPYIRKIYKYVKNRLFLLKGKI